MINAEESNQVRRIIRKRCQHIKGWDGLFDIQDNNPKKVSVLTVSQNRYDEVIPSRRRSEPNHKAEAICRRLKYKSQPFSKRKFVVRKSEFEKMDLGDFQRFVT